jgi:hypothetical protein
VAGCWWLVWRLGSFCKLSLHGVPDVSGGLCVSRSVGCNGLWWLVLLSLGERNGVQNSRCVRKNGGAIRWFRVRVERRRTGVSGTQCCIRFEISLRLFLWIGLWVAMLLELTRKEMARRRDRTVVARDAGPCHKPGLARAWSRDQSFVVVVLMDLAERERTACQRLPGWNREASRRVPRNRARRATRWASFISVGLSLGERAKFAPLDLGLYIFDDVMAASARREISLHLLVPGVHGLDIEPSGKCQLGIFREPGDCAFDGLYGDGARASCSIFLVLTTKQFQPDGISTMSPTFSQLAQFVPILLFGYGRPFFSIPYASIRSVFGSVRALIAALSQINHKRIGGPFLASTGCECSFRSGLLRFCRMLRLVSLRNRVRGCGCSRRRRIGGR